MNKAVREAIDRGREARLARDRADWAAQLEHEKEERTRLEDQARRVFGALKESGLLLKLVEEAEAAGLGRVYLPRTHVAPGVAELINKCPDFEGLLARYSAGYENINSDETKEFWEGIEVTW